MIAGVTLEVMRPTEEAPDEGAFVVGSVRYQQRWHLSADFVQRIENT
jgi:hypothetical protein